LIIRTHGGAILLEESLSYEVPYKTKSNVGKIEKQKIGIEAAKLIEDNDVIILDSGSTTLEIINRIKKKHITLITNDLKIAIESANNYNVKLIVPGGVLAKNVYTLISSDAIDFFRKTYVNKVFLGCDAIDIDYGISNRLLNEARMKLAMINAAREVIVVCDKRKFNKKVAFHICDISRIDKIITDDIDNIYLDFFKKNNVDVILAK